MKCDNNSLLACNSLLGKSAHLKVKSKKMKNNSSNKHLQTLTWKVVLKCTSNSKIRLRHNNKPCLSLLTRQKVISKKCKMFQVRLLVQARSRNRFKIPKTLMFPIANKPLKRRINSSPNLACSQTL